MIVFDYQNQPRLVLAKDVVVQIIDCFAMTRIGVGLATLPSVYGWETYAQITGQPSLPSFAESEDEFFLRVVDAQISFVRVAAEEVVELIVHQNGRDRLWKKVR